MPEPADNPALVQLGEELISKGARDYMVAISTHDGRFFWTSNNKTWAMGAIERCRVGVRLNIEAEDGPCDG